MNPVLDIIMPAMAMNYITLDNTRYNQHPEMQAWCNKHFGEGKWIGAPYPTDWTGLPAWTIHSGLGNTTFAFQDERQYNWFVLRWS